MGTNNAVNDIGTQYFYMALGGNEVAGLPIELFHFDARCRQDSKVVDLYWSTASEINNDFFTIERSTDGIHFESVEIIKGAGNSNIHLDYHFIDENPVLDITSYYRLRQTDFDGKTQTFQMSATNCENIIGGTFDINILKTPINDGSLIYNFNSSTDGLINLKMYDMTGKSAYEQIFYHRHGLNTYYQTVADLPNGIYMLSISDGVQQKAVKFIKQ